MVRVTSRVGQYIMKYCFYRFKTNPRFHARELDHFVKSNVPTVSPETTFRTLRLLKQSGKIDYSVKNSLYEVKRVG